MLRNDGVAFQSGLYKVKYLKSKCTKILLVSECKSNLGLNMSNAKPKYQCLWGSFKSNFQSFINSPVSGSPISLQRAILNRFEAIHAIERSHSAEEQHVCFSYIYIYTLLYLYRHHLSVLYEFYVVAEVTSFVAPVLKCMQARRIPCNTETHRVQVATSPETNRFTCMVGCTNKIRHYR